MKTDLAKQIVDTTEEYLGPAAERFIQRLSNFHLNKEPDELTSKDIKKLSEWVKVSMGMLTSDKALIDDCINKLLKLAK